jgi:DnaJ like chaperone protein
MQWRTIFLAAFAVFSLLKGNIFGVLLAGVLYALDQFFQGLRNNGQRRFGGAAHLSGERQQVFFETTFLVMGHLAKADGRVSEEEIQAARVIMHGMRLTPEASRRAMELFSAGKEPTAGTDAQVDKFRSSCGAHPELIRAFLEIQMVLVLGDGSISSAERHALWRVADRLGVGRVELAQLEAVLLAQRTFGQRQAGADGRGSLEVAYKALGIESSATDKEVKTAYRRLMNQHHPDKLVASGLPDSMMEVAKEKTREIRSAYEQIKDHRGIK